MHHTHITGVILAGGRASRMGGSDKGLIMLNGKPLWKHVAARLESQVDRLAISANRHIVQYGMSGYPVISDTFEGYQGPLAGMLAVMQTLESEWYLFSPCDTPDIPLDLRRRFFQDRGEAPAVWACDSGRDHPTVALVHHSLKGPLHDWLAGNQRRVLTFLQQAGGKSTGFTEADGGSFANVNTPADLQRRQV